MPSGNGPSPSKLFDMLMMALPDGMERSEAQFRAIFVASGFRLAGITPTASPVSVIEVRPVWSAPAAQARQLRLRAPKPDGDFLR